MNRSEVLFFALLVSASEMAAQSVRAPGEAAAGAQAPATPAPAAAAEQSALEQILKRTDDVLWFTRLSDIALVDKVEYTSLPPAHAANPKAPGAVNPILIHAYTFIPKNIDRTRKQPLITFAHQGLHANFDTSDLHVIRELLEQGYSVIASDYRGSTGYGRNFYELIDYGGRESMMCILAPNGCSKPTASWTPAV